MSGSDVPYQLRPNKFVERQLFIEMLEHINRYRPIAEYVYASMGGRFLEDHKTLHSRFRIKSMYSIEGCEFTYDRQVFNRPFLTINCLNCSSGEFVERFEQYVDLNDDRNAIVWLDYTAPSKRREQLQEVQSLISKLRSGDIFKVTMNASPHTLNRTGDQTPHKLLAEQLDSYAQASGIGKEDVSRDGMPRALARAIQRAALDGVQGTTGCTARPLAAFRYADSDHQMLTVAGIVLADDDEEFDSTARIHDWEFAAASWDSVDHIAVPDLSPKERRFIDELIFSEPLEQLHARLSFKFGKKNAESIQKLEQYLTHYRRYPNFVHAAS